MSRLISRLVIVAALGLSGCSAMEQYHYPPAFSEVPTKVKLALSEKYPTYAVQLTQTVAQKMFDGTTRYQLVALDAKSAAHELVFGEDGTEIK